MKVAVYHPEEDMVGEFRHFIESSHNDLEVHGATTPEGLRALIGDIEVLVAFRPPMDMLAQAQNLKWLHYTSAGVDGLMPARDILRDVAVTNSTGIHSIMADYCICTMLMLHWSFPRLHEDQKARLWRPFRTAPMEEFTVGVIGLGSVGQAIVKRAQGFSINVLGMRRTPRSTPGVAKVFGSEQMDEMLPQCDFLMLATPGTPDTAKLIGQRELALMKPSAYLINVGRGNVVDEPSLIAAVQSGQNRRRGAGCFRARAAAKGQSSVGHGERHRHTAYLGHDNALCGARDFDLRGQPEEIPPWRAAS